MMNVEPTDREQRATSTAMSSPPSGWGRRVLLGLVVVLALLGIAGLGWWLRPQGSAAPTRPGRAGSGAVPVVAAVAETGNIPIVLNALGTVAAQATVTVKTQISGQLIQIAFREGQMVHAGDFMAQIDPRPYQMQLDQSQGQLTRDEALLHGAETDLGRYRTLMAQDSIARQQLDTQTSLVQQYRGTVETDRALVGTARLNLAYCHIVAPVTGRVGLRQVDQGNYVTANDANGIVVITQVQPISVVFSLPEDDLPAVARRMRAGATLAVTAFDRSRSTAIATGTLMTTDNQIDTTTGTVKLRAQFDNEDESLFPNQFVNVQLLVDQLQGATVVPGAAIQRGAPGTYVYLVKEDNTVTVRPVKLGPASGDKISVETGLAVGDKVVVDGADKLRENAQVTLPGAGDQPRGPRGQGQRPPGQPGQERPGRTRQ